MGNESIDGKEFKDMNKREFTLTDLFNVALKRLWIILAAIVVGALIALYYSNFMIVPQYQSSTKYFVDTAILSSGENSSGTASIDEQRNTTLAKLVVGGYVEILHTKNFAERIDEILENDPETYPLVMEYSASSIYSSVSYSFEEDSECYTVTVRALDPKDAEMIAKCIENNSEKYLMEKKSNAEGTLKVIDNARYSPAPVNVRTTLNIIMGAFLGAAIAFVAAFLIEINDVRIKNEKEVSEILGLPIIGSIPDYASDIQNDSDYRRYSR